MEKEKKGLFHYFAAEDVLEKGERTRREIMVDSSKDKFSQIVEEGAVGAASAIEAMIISLARLSLLAPAMRTAMLIARKTREFVSGETSRVAE